MLKLTCILLFVFVLPLIASAQSERNVMLGVSYRMFSPACSNCTSLYGPGFSASYAFSSKIVGTLDFGAYSNSESSSTISTTAFGVSADYYLKEAYKGFYIGPDITLVSINQDFNGSVFSKSNLTIGLNLGWAIVVAERWRIIPHFGYGSWYENSNGRITAGLKVGFKI